MTKFLVETYAPRPDALEDAVARARAVTEAMGVEGVAIQHLRAIHVPGDETMFHVFEGPSMEAVGEASERAGLALARVVEMFEAESDSFDTAAAQLAGRGPSDVTETVFADYDTTAEG